MSTALLNSQNYKSGFLVDHEWLAGVSESADLNGTFIAYVIASESGETLGVHAYPDLTSALEAVNQMPRTWSYQALTSCGNCGKESSCSGGKCKGCKKTPTPESTPQG